MGLSFAEAMREYADRIHFMNEQKNKNVKRKPKKIFTPDKELVISRKSLNLIIRQAAINLRQIEIVYRKEKTGEIKHYRVAPYEWNYRKISSRWKRVLWAYDMEDRHIKSFVARNIMKVTLLKNMFKPKWPVQIA